MTTEIPTMRRPDTTKQTDDLIAKIRNDILTESDIKPKWYSVQKTNGERFFVQNTDEESFFGKEIQFTGPANKLDVFRKSVDFVNKCGVDGYNIYLWRDVTLMKETYPNYLHDNQYVELASNKWAKQKNLLFDYHEEIATKQESDNINSDADIHINEIKKKYVGFFVAKQQ